ncbi:Mannan endo-1,6-alpha-mannosidase [Wickerhamomyces ciferrii]|uniref:Mannan endo-1,6-alpha-mannosidase n=1 Tax=Wickerhamomyces ciferrii (strain ATCC 14091 / BCRC 22168 / CBS 111 / JCM 3599 / NBRC 0793 / NRRL Y-1031 F-60-10) TaxID=1206466 RepID=K0KRL2_WICCF|nr:Mannan endo-1,6-alpha-mannosidase [Wickerhamomyces ciferrii]CCH43944.1 Mannan endo-1,6-alpha-mannosidase [Wickerhamomyces ciferrii]
MIVGIVLYSIFLNLLCISCLELDPYDFESIKSATGSIAKGVLDYYDGYNYGKPIGLFQPPYYWWESGGVWGSMLDYSFYTEDKQYDDLIKQSLLAQVGEKWDYVPLNQSTTEGNDDQAFWGLAVMSAAERNFTNPEKHEPQWLYLAQSVFNTMSYRWDEQECGGGLRWQIFQWNSGYDYKNSVSNGCFFQLAARLARYTGNSTYVEWAERVWDWMNVTNLIDGNSNYLVVFDGTSTNDDCSKVIAVQWTYNAGLMLSGAAFLYNVTGNPHWEERLFLLLQGISVYFRDGIMYEAACQSSMNCNNDQRSFKAFFSRFLGLTAQLVPGTRDIIDWYLLESAKAAAQSCSGGTDGVTCGLNWQQGGWDGMYGLGEQITALEVIQNLRYKDKPPPFTAQDGGSSEGSDMAGYHFEEEEQSHLNITPGSKAGASFITIVIGGSIISALIWLIL